jgi:hypothetical protein
VLILIFQSGYAFLLDLLLQFCKVESAVLETSVPNCTNASSSMQVFQSTAACPAEGFVTSPALLEGASSAAVFHWAQMLLLPQGPEAVQGQQGLRRQGH